MALAQIYTAIGGDVITAARWNNEFGNIYTNGTDVAFPLTKAVSLAGFTLTLDAVGVTTISSSASQGISFNPGNKAGTPGTNGSIFNVQASTFNDSNTAGGGTAALWTGFSLRTPTITATNSITTTDAATLYIEGPPTAGANQTITRRHALLVGGDQTIAVADSRTNTVDVPLTVKSTTSDVPAIGIGTGILLQAESQDEVPSDIGQIEFAFSDRTTASEDSYFQILLRVAGAALSAAYRFVATSAFRAIFTHANSADRTYTLPNRSMTFGAGEVYSGPSSTGASSTQAHQGSVTYSASQALDGFNYYTDVTLNASQILTLGNDTDRIVLVATGTITINGTIDGDGAGSTGGPGGVAPGGNGSAGANGYTQTGGGGGNGDATHGAGGAILAHGVVRAVGGGAGLQGDASTGVDALFDPWNMMGGAGGGGGGADVAAGNGGTGGRGGASIVLIAPTIILGSASVLATRGVVGGNGSANDAGGGGGGGGGNILMICNSYTDNGCTFLLTGGAGGTSPGAGGTGGAGRTGVRQINIYA